MPSSCIALLLVVLALPAACGFYLPGIAPVNHADGENIDVKVTSITSTTAQLPYEYYSLPFCSPETTEIQELNLGEILQGDRIQNSPYSLQMGKEVTGCKILCAKKYDPKQIEQLVDKIHDDYYINW
jgi:transmembrane 9 superfamily protein 2/4